MEEDFFFIKKIIYIVWFFAQKSLEWNAYQAKTKLSAAGKAAVIPDRYHDPYTTTVASTKKELFIRE